MRPTTDADAEALILTTDAGRALLAEITTVAAPGPADLARWRKETPPALVAAAVRLAGCRRRGAAKFARADRMWLEATALEQATAEPVARHKARRFAGSIVADLCSGLGGDALALAAVARGVLAVDLDPGMARRTRWNAEVYGVADRLAAIRARAEATPIPAGALVHVDPDRRATPAPRARALRDYVPGSGFLRDLAASGRGGAIKLGPASDFADHFGGEGFEIELISLGGECKEATAWFGPPASCRRRATCLPAGASWTDRDGPAHPPARISPVSAWVFDPDPALIRAGLLDGFAAAHELARLAPGLDLLTGPTLLSSPFLAAFEVRDVLPLDLKRLRRLVAERGLGPLEIKPRGLDLRPETLRAQLRPPGPNPATLLLVGGRGPARAILADRATACRFPTVAPTLMPAPSNQNDVSKPGE